MSACSAPPAWPAARRRTGSPQGDGCAEAETWVNGILHPPQPNPNAPKPKPRPPLALVGSSRPMCHSPIRALTAATLLILAVTARSATVEGLGGPARPVGSFDWSMPSPRFGGFSSLEVSDDGQRFTTLSDRSDIVSGRLLRDAQAGSPASRPARSPICATAGAGRCAG